METMMAKMTEAEFEAEVEKMVNHPAVQVMEESLPPAINLEEMVEPGPAGWVNEEFLERSNQLFDQLTQNAYASGRPVKAVPLAMLRIRQAKRAELDRLVDRQYL